MHLYVLKNIHAIAMKETYCLLVTSKYYCKDLKKTGGMLLSITEKAGNSAS